MIAAVRTLVATVSVALLAAAGLAVAATATTTKNGLPAYTDGYTGWRKLNRRPITTPGAHNGIKNVYASRPSAAVNRRFPNGTVIVKSIVEPGAKGLATSAVLRVILRGDGSFETGRLVPTRLVGVGVPALDRTEAAHGVVRELSRDDFGARGVNVTPDGVITR